MTLALIALPMVALALAATAASLAGRPFGRRTLNVLVSLLLLAYLAGTAGLGLFWVANQELPAFDLHYLFGYVTLLVLGWHLVFNLRVVLATLRGLRRRRGTTQARSRSPGAARVSQKWALLLAAGLGFLVGVRAGEDRIVLPRADVHGTSAAGAGAVDDVGSVLLYHERASHSRVRALLRSPSTYWGSLPTPYKRYPGKAVVRLPPPRPGASAAVSRSLRPRDAGDLGTTGPLSLQDLSNLLFFTNGVTDHRWGIDLRAAASAGALYPTEIYVGVHAVRQLEPGLYHYAVEKHVLHRLSQSEPGTALARAAGRRHLSTAPVTLVLTAVMSRSASKYGDRAFRYAVADTGHVARNTLAVATGMGYGTAMVGQFDDEEINRLVGVDGVEEVALLLLTVGGDRSPAGDAESVPSPAIAGRNIVRWQSLAAEDAPLEQAGSVGLVHTVTSLRRHSPQEDSPSAPPAPVPRQGEPLISLPAPLPRLADTFESIRQRRSRRTFGSDPLPLAELSSTLKYGVTPVLERRARSLAVESNAALDTWLVVHAVSGLAPGVYRFHAGPHALELVRQVDPRPESFRAGLSQAVVRDAAALIVLAADTSRLFTRHGPRGYRYALLDAGLVGQGVYLDGEAGRLSVCSVGAFYEPEINELILADPKRYLVLHTVALGPRP